MFQTIYTTLLLVSFVLLCSQLWVRQKQPIHLLFAAFCGSIAIMAIKQLGGTELGFYQYLLGMGVCMTCNGYWLVARALFRQQQAIRLRHLLAAASVALLIITLQALQLLQLFWPQSSPLINPARFAVQELLVLLSSSLMMLAFWEGCRGYRTADAGERWQRQLFLGTYVAAITSGVVIAKIWQANTDVPLVREMLAAGAAIAVLLVTQWLIYNRFHRHNTAIKTDASTDTNTETTSAMALGFDTETEVLSITAADKLLCDGIRQLLFQQQLFLQANLRLTDLAKQLDVPEYRISKLLRSQFQASNFNQFINTLRIAHAKTLLADPSKGHWPVVVVGLESGFASVGPFSRAFKTMVGFTPHEFRQTFGDRFTDKEP
ncbi:AraC family transcriptional regulator [Rheinheimera riviphila]|uniref:AraC family transcriptional regulator n=1 Tax=Rheinheimera riviphila TaxID=1834037 RepID=A0A437QLI5_9GAMM|nr:helix-turn-helix transcriptional regulator [Rheinheimera riviphila]RVU35376.1 AraC family transcriptional regulator [Rheinheimera riviphila]